MQSKQAAIEKRYVMYQVLKSLWFIGAVWLLFYRLFMTDQRVGVLDGLSFGLGLLFEIPSGALADHFGRKRITILGIVVSAFGMSLQGFAHGFIVILLGQMLVTAGWAFSSGADEALFYDALNYNKEGNDWKKLVSRGRQASLLAGLAAYLIGGYMYSISPGLPFIACTFTALGIFPLLGIKEVIRERKHKASKHLTVIKRGITELLKPELIGYLPIILIVQGLFYVFGYGLLRPILQTRFGFGASAGAWVLFVCGVTAFLLQRLQYKYIAVISEKFSITLITLSTATALLAGCFKIGHVGFAVILVIYVNEFLLEPLISSGLNKHVESNHRATTLSAASFVKSLTYVVAAPLIGYLNVRGKLHIYFIAMAFLFMLAISIYLNKVRETA
jgi:MFS family permease